MKMALRLGIVLLVILPSLLYAQVGERLNARIMPLVWFSTLQAQEGESLRVYAAVQNNSGIGFSGAVRFYANGVEIGAANFSSPKDSLEEVSVAWKATEGKHSFYATIEPKDLEGELIAYKSGEATFDVAKKITTEEVKEGIVSTASVVVEKIGEVATALADKLEASKKPALVLEQTEGGEQVLGASTSTERSWPTTIYNTGVGALAFLLRHWMWTLSGAALLTLYWLVRH